ncbi:hypothetical protein DU504_11910 [Haloplanus salinus]|uniref:Uncharacterized protein n=1 Tax=Haloplanus salinus TaxID=1126245 RepID=A0A368NBI3_9EURY|nr:hypothetical protein [Haloplanus salinus]RCU47937.1 hypothetical protein DU504_11910 [Haloplanus salinus]
MTDIVEIIVAIKDEFSRQINDLDRKLTGLEKHRNKNVNVDVNGFAQIERMNRHLNWMARDRVANVYINRMGQRAPGGGVLSGGPVVSIGRAGGMAHRAQRSLGKVGLRAVRAQDMLADSFGRMRSSLSRLIPSYHLWIALVSAVLPVLIVLATAAFGVAAAFAAIAVAGAGLIGLGLIGQGNSMAESFARAQQSVQEFKSELYDVFKPVAQQFAPFADRFLENAPERMLPLARALESLRRFEDYVERAFGGLVDWTAMAITEMAAFQDQIGFISDVFGPAVGSAFINFLKFVVTEASENAALIMRLGRAFVAILKLVYEMSVAFSTLVAVFSPLIEMAVWFADLLGNKWVIALLTVIVAVAGLAAVLWTVLAAGGAAAVGLMHVITVVQILNANLTTTFILLSALTAGLMLLVGLGAAYLAVDHLQRDLREGGSFGSGYSRGSAGLPGRASAAGVGTVQNTYNVTINGGSNLSGADVAYQLKQYEREREARERNQ